MSSVYEKTFGMMARGIIPSSRSSRRWALGDISEGKTRTHYEREGIIENQTGICIATEVTEDCEEPTPDPGATEVIIKIKIQLTPWDSDKLSSESYREIQNLEQLTDAGCNSTPRLIEYFTYKQHNQMFCPGGYIVFIVMERIPGQDLGNFGNLSPQERDSVRIAFIKALWEFRDKGFTHDDPDRENIMWDKASQRCFIIDLEDAWDTEVCKEDFTMDPVNQFSYWNLNSAEIRSVEDHPMMLELRRNGQALNNLRELVAFLQSRRCIS